MRGLTLAPHADSGGTAWPAANLRPTSASLPAIQPQISVEWDASASPSHRMGGISGGAPSAIRPLEGLTHLGDWRVRRGCFGRINAQGSALSLAPVTLRPPCLRGANKGFWQ